jgi:plastocyanin
MAMTNTTLRRRAGIVVVVIGLAALGLAGPADAEKAAPSQKTQQPADDITGQDHPADVMVQAWQYIPPTVHVKRGGKIKFGNYDMYPYGAGIAAHSMEEAIPGCTSPPYHTNKGCDRYPKFTSALTDHGYVHNVEGVDKLSPGEYPFTCQIHSQMRGTLVIE